MRTIRLTRLYDLSPPQAIPEDALGSPSCSNGACPSEVDGVLYELDGRKDAPVPHGSTSPDTLLQDACAVVKQFMDRDPGELR